MVYRAVETKKEAFYTHFSFSTQSPSQTELPSSTSLEYKCDNGLNMARTSMGMPALDQSCHHPTSSSSFWLPVLSLECLSVPCYPRPSLASTFSSNPIASSLFSGFVGGWSIHHVLCLYIIMLVFPFLWNQYGQWVLLWSCNYFICIYLALYTDCKLLYVFSITFLSFCFLIYKKKKRGY